MSEKLKFPKERLMTTLLAPCITEKTSMGAMNGQYAFKVLNAATKPVIKEAVEFLFDVKVENVQVSNVKGKTKRFGRLEGKRKGWKKAYVTLAEGQKIEFTGA
jgi:large subunit ribosomal protein L23